MSGISDTSGLAPRAGRMYDNVTLRQKEEQEQTSEKGNRKKA